MKNFCAAVVGIALTLVAGAAGAAPCVGVAPPALLAPPDGATGQDLSVDLRWTAVAGATKYTVWGRVDDDTEFREVADTTEPTLAVNVDPDTFVEWFVVATLPTCTVESAHFTFTTRTCPSAVATLLTPANGATGVNSPVRFSWTPVPGAVGYRIWLGAADKYDVLDETDADTTTITVRIPPGTWDWLVETFFDGCPSGDSGNSRFTIPRAANCPTAGPALIAPAQGSSVQGPVTFEWQPSQGAIGYEVWASLDGNDYAFVGDTTGTSLRADLGDGEVAWFVRAQFNGCDDTDSADGFFSHPADPACNTGATYLITPADGDEGVPLAVDFIWTPVSGAISYNVWASFSGGAEHIIGSTTATRLRATVPAGRIFWFAESVYASCPSDYSSANEFSASSLAQCREPAAPELYVDPEASSGDSYYVIFSPGLNTASYELQESTRPDFSDATTRSVNDVLLLLDHTVSQTTRYYYRVRSMSSCGLGFGPYSKTASIVITPVVAQSVDNAQASAVYGKQDAVVQKVHIPGSGNTAGKKAVTFGFTATTDKPWLTVTPSTGTIPPEGIDLTISADPAKLPGGSSTGTLFLSTTGTPGALAAPVPSAVPIGVNLVSPVTPNAGNSPLPQSLIIPAVGHAVSSAAVFSSDIRIANTSAQIQKYLLNFTPTQSDGTKTGSETTVQVEPGETLALNDLLKNFFGFAVASDNVQGVLEIRPLTHGSSPSPFTTFASSRTFATTANGTYGQFIPALPFSSFIGKTQAGRSPVLSLQQVAQSAAFRTNLGLVEAAGEPATVGVTVFGDDGTSLGTFPISLLPGEHKQFGQFLASQGISLNDGRIEVSVLSNTGRVTAYASVLDNTTQDPLLVFPVNTTDATAARRYVLPGIADVGAWRTDVRIFNAGTSSVAATLFYYPQAGNAGASAPVTLTIRPGEVKTIDSALKTLFNVANSGGSLVVTTVQDSKLVVTGRTYNQTGNGTYGQFIPGLTPRDGVGNGERALQILQVEESDRFYTNVGVFELTGNPVTVEVSVISPDSRVTPKATLQLGPNEFLQLTHLLGSSMFNLPNTYNARVAVRVVGGTGRIGGYGSLIDQKTKDPTYVPAQ